MSMLSEHRQELDGLLHEKQLLDRKKKDHDTQLRDTRERLAACKEAQEVAQGIAERVQQTAFGSISAVVTRCLKMVFGEDSYEFRIDVRQLRGKTDAKIWLEKDGVGIDNPMASCGGGVVDIISFGARIAALRLAKPARRRLLLLDEPMRFVSKQYRAAAAEMMEVFAEELDVQIVQVTHMPEFRIGRVIELGGEDE